MTQRFTTNNGRKPSDWRANMKKKTLKDSAGRNFSRPTVEIMAARNICASGEGSTES